MARIRSLKPEIWSSESTGRLSREARLLLVGLITQADDGGRIRASSRGLASLIYPFDTDVPTLIDGWLAELDREGMFHRYDVDGSTYGYLPKFIKHQKIDHPSPSKIPAPNGVLANPREPSRILAPDQGSRIKDQGKDQGGDRVFDSPVNEEPKTPNAADQARELRSRFPCLKFIAVEVLARVIATYGLESIAKRIAKAQSYGDELDRAGFDELHEGRKSAYGGWDLWTPLKPLAGAAL